MPRSEVIDILGTSGYLERCEERVRHVAFERIVTGNALLSTMANRHAKQAVAEAFKINPSWYRGADKLG